MKFYLYLIISLLTAFSGFGQENLKLTVEWNSTSGRYEVYVISQQSANNFMLSEIQVGIVLPNTAPAQKLIVTSHAAGNWADQKFVNSPNSSAQNQYHKITSNGGVVNLSSNQGGLLFSFKLADGSCKDGVRLYNNGADPGKEASGFDGVDFSNSILGVNNSQIYGSNVSNSGTKCMDCPVNFSLPKLKKRLE